MREAMIGRREYIGKDTGPKRNDYVGKREPGNDITGKAGATKVNWCALYLSAVKGTHPKVALAIINGVDSYELCRTRREALADADGLDMEYHELREYLGYDDALKFSAFLSKEKRLNDNREEQVWITTKKDCRRL